MSTPRSGVMEVFAGTPAFTVLDQGTGVLVAPDELLTAAHVVDGSDGVETMVAVQPGTGGATPSLSSFAASTVHVDPGFTPGSNGMEPSTDLPHDFALIHLSQPVSGTVYALGTSNGGTLTVGGYPNGTGSTYDEATETFSPSTDAPGMLAGASLSADPRGSSGGPVLDLSGAAPTVVGLVTSSGASPGVGDFLQLSASDIAEIQGWIASDQMQGSTPAPAPVVPAPTPDPTPVAPAPTPVAVAPTPATATPAPAVTSPTPRPAPTSPLEALAAAIGDDAGASPNAVRQTAMTDVSNALAHAASCGDTGIEGARSDAAALIRGGSSAPRRALAYLGGMLSALGGSGRAQALSDAADAFPMVAAGGGNATLDRLAMAGWTEMNGLSERQASRAVSPSDLAAAISAPSGTGGTPTASAIAATSQVASILAPVHHLPG